MTQDNTLYMINIISNLPLNKLKSGIKNNNEVTLKLSSNVGDSNDENNFPHKSLLITAQVSRPFTNNSSANIKLSKTQLHRIGQSGEFLDRLLGPLLKAGLPLMKNVLKTLAKRVLIPLGLTAASATDAAVHKKKMLGSGFTTLKISNEEMNDIMKIVKSLEESSLLIKRFSETIKNEAEEQKGRPLSMLLGTLAASLLGNLLAGNGTIREDEGTFRAWQDF